MHERRKVMATLQFRAGRLLCGELRDFLKKLQFLGHDIQFMESSGFLERDFIIKGDDELLGRIRDALTKWVQENGYD